MSLYWQKMNGEIVTYEDIQSLADALGMELPTAWKYYYTRNCRSNEDIEKSTHVTLSWHVGRPNKSEATKGRKTKLQLAMDAEWGESDNGEN